jgi:hypothetical protein
MKTYVVRVNTPSQTLSAFSPRNPVALLGLLGGPDQGEYIVYTDEMKPEDVPSMFPGYELQWLKDDYVDYRDPLSTYDWVAKFTWKGTE